MLKRGGDVNQTCREEECNSTTDIYSTARQGEGPWGIVLMNIKREQLALLWHVTPATVGTVFYFLFISWA